MIGKLKALNDMLIEMNVNNVEELEKQKLIKRLLSDKNCFFKMDIESVYSILRDLTIPDDDIENVYCELVDIKNS